MIRTRRDMESELQSLLPKAPSDRVLNSIANELARARRTPHWASAWTWGAAALAVAAGTAFAVLWWPQLGEIPGPSPSLRVVDRQHLETPDLPPATMLSYQHAMAQSPHDLNDLLDRHAVSLLVAGSPSDDIESLYRELMPNYRFIRRR